MLEEYKKNVAGYRCHLKIWKGLGELIRYEEDADTSEALSMIKSYRRQAILDGAKTNAECILYSAVEYDEVLDIITTVNLFVAAYLTKEKLADFTGDARCIEFGVLFADSRRALCKKVYDEEKSKRIVPVTLKAANDFVRRNHRHHDSVTGCKFAIGLVKTVEGEDRLIGVAICGRPVSRVLDDGLTLEVNRLCVTDDEANGCSMLYSASVRTANDMGYKKVITYILESESGVSLKASGFVLEDGCCGGKDWGPNRINKSSKIPPKQMKQRWVKILK